MGGAVTALLLLLVSGDALLCQRDGCNCTQTPHGAEWLVEADCVFDDREVVVLEAGAAPAELVELRVRGGAELRLLAGAMSRVRQLQRVLVAGSGRLLLRRRCFAGAVAAHVIVDVANCREVVVETGAFTELAAPLSVALRRVAHVVLQASAFGRLRLLAVATVPSLEMQTHALALDVSDGAAAVVRLENVILAEIPPHAFPSPAAEVRLVDVEVRAVRRDAFSAILVSSLAFVNSTLHAVEGGAFSEATLIDNLEMTGVHVGVLAPGAVLSGATNVTLRNCRISETQSGAFNNTVAAATLEGNVLESVRARGLVLRGWNRLLVVNNTFGRLDADAVVAPFQPAAGSARYEFAFEGNRVEAALSDGALRFVDDAAAGVWQRSGAVSLAGNSFAQQCSCNLSAALGAGRLMRSSSCVAAGLLARCLGVPDGGALPLANFSAAVCGSDAAVACEETPAGQVLTADDAAASSEGKTLLALLLAAALLGAASVAGVSGIVWLRKRGYITPCLALLSRRRAERDASPGPAAAHVYAELQRPDVAADDEEEDEAWEGEDKWTQTLPEELTQEVLQTLREKLDDPDNYAQARDMIEHLYDLVKVEESGRDYDSTPRRPRRQPPRPTRSRGTSPAPPLLCQDYAEPSDARPHVYTELPLSMANRPLPRVP